MTSHSTDKLEMMCVVAREFLCSPAATLYESIEVNIDWITLDHGETFLPNITIKMGPSNE